ncbi:hypothetical protein [Glutamicibacter halophytocola]|uniref:hypothetical protein n=1 Tax=Glutamicibacter halophytocola TaxID=1933880 RepID=UPI0015C55FBF|nr:hypothetical protein [Glutamicibacter halophytocola]NQD39973.1 hypothetical protein [Glutamicibacter halophytocola]
MAGKYDFIIEQGATFGLMLTWKDESDTPIDLTGYTARLKAMCGEQEVLSLTNGESIALGGAEGTIQLSLSAERTAALAFNSATYDLELVQGEYVKRLLQGVVVLSPEYTT